MGRIIVLMIFCVGVFSQIVPHGDVPSEFTYENGHEDHLNLNEIDNERKIAEKWKLALESFQVTFCTNTNILRLSIIYIS